MKQAELSLFVTKFFRKKLLIEIFAASKTIYRCKNFLNDLNRRVSQLLSN